jgi:SanA protein
MTPGRRILLFAVALLLTPLAGMALIHRRVHRFDQRISRVEQVDSSGWKAPRVAIVFGAGVLSDGTPSRMLEDRVRAAAELYRAQKVDRILVSGDNRFVNYNEPKAMREYLVTHAVAPDDVILDYAGRSTYETCLRARQIFGVRQAVLVTQQFHLPRALYLAHELGIDTLGVIADRQDYGSELGYQQMREIGAEIKAFFNIHVKPPDVVMGDKIPIE